MNTPDIILGAKGWRHASWEGAFYPDDLPPEWQLSYYSNEFDSVLVPADYVNSADPASLHAWVEDTREGFTFFLELPVGASNAELDNAKLDNAELDNVLAPLAPRLGGILISELSVPVTSAQVEIIEKAQRYAPVVAPWDALTAAGESLASLQNVGCYWRPEETDLTVCGGGLGIAELTSGVSHDPKALKNILQHCRSLQGATTIGVFFGGDAPRIEEIHNAIMILQLMG